MQNESLNVSIVVASKGRPADVARLVQELRRQTEPAQQIILSCVSLEDCGGANSLDGIEVTLGSAGLCAQRNRGLELVSPDTHVIGFVDDDYYPHSTTLEGVRRIFANEPDVVGANGVLLADGIHGLEISAQDAEARLAGCQDPAPKAPRILKDLEGLYGCNMFFRASAVKGVRFDESLPLYGWQEDIDFSAQIGVRGRLVLTDAFIGIHRGVKSSRLSGLRLGYSQVANPVYLVNKGSMTRSFAWRLMIRNIIANHIKSVRPEAWVDRSGRAKGNRMAIRDLLSGRLDRLKGVNL